MAVNYIHSFEVDTYHLQSGNVNIMHMSTYVKKNKTRLRIVALEYLLDDCEETKEYHFSRIEIYIRLNNRSTKRSTDRSIKCIEISR